MTCSLFCFEVMYSTIYCSWMLLEPGSKTNTFVKKQPQAVAIAVGREDFSGWSELYFYLLVHVLLIIVKPVLISESL